MLDDLRRDVVYAVRQLTRAPGFTAVAVLTLGLGVGANTAIFSVVNGLLLRPLPFHEPDRLLFVDGVLSRPDREVSFQLSYPDIQDLRTQAKTIVQVAPWATSWGLSLERTDGAQRLDANFVGEQYFEILGGVPLLGRTFSHEDHAVGTDGALVAILSEATWRQDFGANPAIVGTEVRLQNRVFTVIGVMPDAFSDLPESSGERIDVWAPIERAPSLFGLLSLSDRGSRLMWGVARLTEGSSLQAARAELSGIGAAIARENPATNTNFSIRPAPLSSRYFVDARRPLWFLLGGSIFVLLIGCANVANLLLVRSEARTREFAVRLAIGASTARLVRQLLVESLLLALAGAAAGLLIAIWIAPVLLRLSRVTMPAFTSVTMDGAVLLVTMATACACALLFGFAPMWRAVRTNPRDATAASAVNRVARSSGVSRWIAGVEIAAAFVLTAGALVLLQSLSALTATDLAFRSDQLLTVRLELPQDRYRTPEARARAGDALLQQVKMIPGVETAAIWGPSMFARSTWVAFLAPADRVVANNERLMVWRHSTNPGALSDLGIPLLAGRDFLETDRLGAPLVAILSEAAAERLWPGQDAIGKQMRTSPAPTAPLVTVIGVAKDARHRGRFRFSSGAAAFEPQLDIYLPYAQLPNSLVVFGIRTIADPSSSIGAVRNAIASVDPTLATYDVETLPNRMRTEAAPLAFAALLINLYGGLAILLAGVGVYGVLAAAVAGRMREIGIRSALGAEPRRLLTQVMFEGLSIATLAILTGGVAAWVLLRSFSGVLFGISGGNELLLAGAALLLTAIAAAASLVPARRAANADPITVLRNE